MSIFWSSLLLDSPESHTSLAAYLAHSSTSFARAASTTETSMSTCSKFDLDVRLVKLGNDALPSRSAQPPRLCVAVVVHHLHRLVQVRRFEFGPLHHAHRQRHRSY
jgi:hypothetical protein